MAEQYNAQSIESLDYFEHIRRYPGMYIGSKDAKGLLHCVKEIISNSIDEYLNNSCSKINVTIKSDGGILISDDGRGIPHGQTKAGYTALFACFGVQSSGGKFNNATGESGYNTSGGEHGTGAKAVNALSKKLIVSTTRDGVKETIEFSKGKKVQEKQTKAEGHGVEVLFYPDETVLECVKFDSETIEKMLQEFSFLCKNLTFTFKDEILGKKKIFCSKNGLFDYLNYLSNQKENICKPIYFENKNGTFQVEVAIGYTAAYSSTIRLYTNNIPQEKGTHLTGFKTAWTSSLNNFAREKKWLKDKDENLTGSDFDEGQILILNFKMIDPVFKGQNKEELSSSEGRTYVQKLTTETLKTLLSENEKEIKKIVDKALNARKAREAAKKARDNARQPKDKKSKLLNLPTKLVDCWSKKRENCELFIAEGDSAASGLIAARDGEFQAIMPIRGKIINCFKATTQKVLENNEITSFIKATGLEFDTKTTKLIYDKNKLRYNKILTAADADADGEAIKNLLLTSFWWLCPELITNGHVYVTIPPLFRITTKNNKFVYLRDAVALEEYKKTHQGEKYLINRNKGLGEQSSEELGECILDPNTRNIAQITVADVQKAATLLDVLMGTSVPPRREYILKHSEEANN